MELNMLTVQYLTACESEKRLDKKTIKAYRIDLRQFSEYIIGQAVNFDRDTIKNYTAYMNQKFKPSTVKRKIASIRAFVTWLMESRHIKENPFENLRLKVQKPMLLPRIIPLWVIKKMLEAAHKRQQQNPDNIAVLRETAVMEMLFATGMRVSELSGLETRNIDLKDGVIRIFGKGSKERIAYLGNAEVLETLRKYAETCQPERNGTFFLNSRGNRLSEQSVRNIVRKYGELADYPTRITPHMFRHSIATLLLEEEVDIRYIQRILGHSSILTTQIYTYVAETKQREIMEERHPRNGFSCC